VEAGEVEAGIAEMEQAVGQLAGISSAIGAPQILCVLANALRTVGRHDDALGVLALAVAAPAGQDLHFYDAELHRLRADILLEAPSDAAEAAALLQQSLEIARSQAAKTFELRAAMSLARMWQRQGKADAARALLAPLCAWFTEGFDTRDLRDAKALLGKLATA
jgi:predicted ATPase